MGFSSHGFVYSLPELAPASTASCGNGLGNSIALNGKKILSCVCVMCADCSLSEAPNYEEKTVIFLPSVI